MTKTLYYIPLNSDGTSATTPIAGTPTDRLAATFGYESKTQYVHPTSNGRAFRCQGPTITAQVAGDNRLLLFSNRIKNNLDGRSETFQKLAAKGQTHFRCQHQPEDETDYQSGFSWFYYGNQGTNGGSKQYDHNTYNLLVDDMSTIHTFFLTILKEYTDEVEIVVGNFEYYWFNTNTGDSINSATWSTIPSGSKSQTFYSYYSGSNTTMQAIYDAGGVNLLNQHLHVKHRRFVSLWCQMLRVRAGSNPIRVTNGDNLFMQRLHPNGDFNSAGTVRSIRDWRTFDYDFIKNWSNQNEGVWIGETCGGGTDTLGGHVYDFTGHQYEHWDMLNQYLYITNDECRMRQSDYNSLVGNTDTLAWNQKFIISSHSYYTFGATFCVRKKLFDLHKNATGKDFNRLPLLSQFEKMYECGYIRLIADDVDEVNASFVGEGSIWMPWVEASAGSGNGQKHLLQKEYVFTRVLIDSILAASTGTADMQGGILEWWEGDPTGIGTGDFSQDYSLGKYQYFNDVVLGFIQEAIDRINRRSHLFGTGSSCRYMDIPFRWRRPGGSWSAWYRDYDPAKAAFHTENGVRHPLPQIYEQRKGGAAFYVLQVGQAKFGPLNTMEVEFEAFDGTVIPVTLNGPMPRDIDYDPALAIIPSGTVDSSIAANWNTLQPIS